MKSLSFILLLTLVFTGKAFASDRDQRLSQILKENKVLPAGKRQDQYANMLCSVSKKKTKDLSCVIWVEGIGPYDVNLVYEELKGEKAQELSALLLEYSVYPEGKRETQRVRVNCGLKVKTDPESFRCSFISSRWFH